MEFKDYYQTMGVERSASPADIKKAYRKLAHQYHPDISKDPKGESKFKEIGEAYATLKDPEKRSAYDELGKRKAGEKFTPPPDWQQQFDASDSDYDNVDLSDIFAAFGGAARNGGARHNSPRPGQDYEVTAPVTIENIFHGAEIEVRAELPEMGEHGSLKRVMRTFRITVPKGAADGQRLRLGGKGGPGSHGGRDGDLYVALALQSHPLYRVSGRDLYIDLPLTPWEAILGAAIRVPSLGGMVELKLKPGTVAGQKLRFPHHGLVSVEGTQGAMYAVVNIVVPKTVNAEERALLEQWAAISTFDPRQHYFPGAML